MTGWADTRSSQSLSTRFRTRRDRFLRAFVEARLEQRVGGEGPFRILDLGGTADYWQRVGYAWLEANDIEVTCVNYVATERGAAPSTPRIGFIVGDACDMAGHQDMAYDLVHSNSVIEHVGRWPDMRRFADEVRRLGPSYYVQTPYFWFPLDPHFHRIPFFHWMPESIRMRLLRRFRVGYSGPARTVDKAMTLVMSNLMLDRTQFGALFPDAAHRFEWLAGLPKSMIAVRG